MTQAAHALVRFHQRLPERMAVVLFLACLALVTKEFFATWGQLLLERHGFRQTQTALTAYWLQRGGDFIDYLTPVIGHPWSIPFEMPWYQWLAARLSLVSGLDLDRTGRLIAFLFSLATLVPAGYLLRFAGLSWAGVWSFGALYLMCPEYAFWGRSFMMETAALFFSCAYLALLVAWLRCSRSWVALAALVFGVLAGTQKVTSFAPFWIVGGVLLAMAAVQQPRLFRVRVREGIGASYFVWAFLIVVLPLAVTTLWVRHADGVRALNMVGAEITRTLPAWNFGTWEQRWSSALWRETVFGRLLELGTFGWAGLAFLVGAAAFALTPRTRRIVLVALALFLLPLLLFPNLHVVHDYYQVANAIGLVVVAAVVADELFRVGPWRGLLFLATMLAAEGSIYANGYLGVQRGAGDAVSLRTFEVARMVRELVPADRAVLGFGFSWSSELAYYSERRALTVPTKWPVTDQILAVPDDFLGGVPLGAAVVCPNGTDVVTERLFEKGLDRIAGGWRMVPVRDCILYVAP